MTPRFSIHSRQDSSGIALVMVLCILVLISGLVLAFFSTIYTESELGANRTAQAEADRLADSALQIVMGQIREATTQEGKAWASQPGAIFNYDEAGEPTIYKLYSAENMIVSNPSNDPFGVDLPAAAAEFTIPGKAYSALWADLNTPVIVKRSGSSTPIFPIVNPLASQSVGDDPPVEGFSIDQNAINGIVTAAGNPTEARLPMPVKWLYLTSTNVAAPGPGGGNASVSVSGASDPSSQIIGRVAFWTDDDTSKVNVNTAGGDRWTGFSETELEGTAKGFGTFWDVPLGYSKLETDLARYQPWNREFQRYPGHPATVFLSAIFPNLTAEQIAGLIPRITYGDESDDSGSRSGTNGLPDENVTGSTKDLERLELDKDRLYASLDEVYYKEDRTEQGPNLLTAERLNRVSFFATARSSAPELTLFGTPRIAIWPIHAVNDETHRSTFDRLIAFCSTIPNGLQPSDRKAYYFQRADADSPTSDFADIRRNRELYEYLRRLTSDTVPGFGASFVGPGYTTEERDQILTQIFDYVRSTNLWDPLLGMRAFSAGGGSGITFTDGYNDDPTVRPADEDTTAVINRSNPGLGQVAPIRIGDTQGFGRFPTVSEAGFVFIANAESPRSPAADETDGLSDDERDRERLRKRSASSAFVLRQGGGPLAGSDATVATPFDPENDGQRMVQAWFPVEFNYPMAGFLEVHPDFTVQIEFTDPVTLSAEGVSELIFPAGRTATFVANTAHARIQGGPVSVDRLQEVFYHSDPSSDKGTYLANVANVVSDPVILPYSAVDPLTNDPPDESDMTLSAGKVTIRLYAGDTVDESRKVQELVLDCSRLNGPLPQPFLAVNFRLEGATTFPDLGNADLDSYLEEQWWTFTESVSGTFRGRLTQTHLDPAYEKISETNLKISTAT